jgi:hypothetical protein
MSHNYTSTACQHALHDECRRTCKFCQVACACSCHTTSGVYTTIKVLGQPPMQEVDTPDAA